MADNDPTRRYAWDGDDVQFPSSKSSKKSPVGDRISDDTEKVKKEAKAETSGKENTEKKQKGTKKSPVRDRKSEDDEKEKKEAKADTLEKDYTEKNGGKTEKAEKKNEVTKKEKPEKEKKEKGGKEKETAEKEKNKGEKEKENPEKEKKKKCANLQPAPDDLVRAIEEIIIECLVPPLCTVFTSGFKKANAYIAKGRTAEDYVLNRDPKKDSKVHEEFKEFCKSQLCVADIESLDALTELIDDKDNVDYLSFINRFHDIWETYFKDEIQVHLETDFYELLEKSHDKYWGVDDKTKTPEKEKKEAHTETSEKEKKGKKKEKPEKKDKKDEKNEKEKKGKKKKSGHVQPPPQDLVLAVIDFISHSLVTSLVPVFLIHFPGAGSCLGDGRTPMEYLHDRTCDFHQEFKESCSSQHRVLIESLDALTELLDDKDNVDCVSFITRFHGIWETYFKSWKDVYHNDKFYLSLEKFQDKYWDEED